MSAAHAVIPVPAAAELSSIHSFTVTHETQIIIDADSGETVTRIARYLGALIGDIRSVVRSGTEAQGEGMHTSTIRLRMSSSVSSVSPSEEAYDLAIAPDGVILTASQPAGLFYGVQTIRQLLPVVVDEGPVSFTLPVGQILDFPRFVWRGTMLDVARHFLPLEDVKRFIDVMSMYKLNRLHLHLSDDQGWRIEIPSRPLLTVTGASTQVGGGEGGFYSADDWADLIRYAGDHFVMIVPEIDMPGHIHAALASYPELTCDGQARELYTGTEVGFSYLCVEKKETYDFVEDIIRDIAAMTPGPYFHIGGDEVHKLSREQYAQFMERTQAIVAEHGKTVVGWDEIAETHLDLIDGSVVQAWRPQTEATAQAVAGAVAQGAKVVLSPANHIYLDMKYDSTTVLGLSWAGLSDVENAYMWEPATLIPGVPETAILGIEAPIWSESLGKLADFEYMAYPRLAGVAEIGWSSAELRSWDTYRVRLGAHGLRWTALGVNFYPAPGVPWQQPRQQGR